MASSSVRAFVLPLVIPLLLKLTRLVTSWRLDPEDLSRVHDVFGVDRLLDRVHYAHRLAVLGDQEIDLAAADAVLAGAGAVERQRAMDQPLVEALRLRHLSWVVRIEHEADVKIAVACMANDRCP